MRDVDSVNSMRRDDILGSSWVENTRAGRHPFPALPTLNITDAFLVARRGYSGWSTPSSCIPNLNNLGRRLFFSRVEYQFFKVSTVVVVRFSLDGAFSWRKRRMEMFELKIPTIRSVKRKVFPSRVLAKLAPLFQSNWSGTIEGRQI